MSPNEKAPRRGSPRSPRAHNSHVEQNSRLLKKRPHGPDLEGILDDINVSFIKLTECLIEDGWRLPLCPVDRPSIHYVLTGHGVMTFQNGESSPLSPHTLVILPSGQEAWVDVPCTEAVRCTAGPEKFSQQIGDGNTVPRRFVAGDGTPALIFICGYFCVQHGRAIDLFGHLTAPIVEAFGAGEGLDNVLKTAQAELLKQDLGMGVMTSSLMKQVLVHLFRRALTSPKAWVDNVAILGDAQISRVLAAMVAQPGSNHSLHSLAQLAGLSRSVFMARFSKLFGQSPMSVLQSIRMRRAAALLATNKYQVHQVAHFVGYASRSSFCRVFQKSYGYHPSAHASYEREHLIYAAPSSD